jgi:hypothetical protein
VREVVAQLLTKQTPRTPSALHFDLATNQSIPQNASIHTLLSPIRAQREWMMDPESDWLHVNPPLFNDLCQLLTRPYTPL